MPDPVQGGDNSDDEIHGKIRRNEAEWKQNKRKSLKSEGKEYISYRGKTIFERTTGNKCRCQRQCLLKFSDETKRVLLENFNSFADQKAQDAFLSGGISAAAVQRRRARIEGGPQRSVHVHYKIKHGEEERVVCRDGYASHYGVGVGRIRRVTDAVKAGSVPTDNRGRHNNRPNALTAESKQLMEDHIRSFPYQVSHYGRERTKRRYLSPELSVRHMFVLFLEKEFPEAYLEVKGGKDPETVECSIRHRTYYNYFKDNFNYGFGRPKTDVCGTCAELKVKIGVEKNEASRRRLQTEYELHRRKAQAFYNKLKADSTLAEVDDEVDTISIDYEQNIPFPHLPVGEIFYMRQLWLYNFCIYSSKTQKSTMYMYPEMTARRGANEVISCLMHYFTNKLTDGVKKLKVYSDGCRGQNHNHSVVQFFFTLVKTGRMFDSIEHHFPMRGHSFLPCDRHFATIERKKRKKESVEWYHEWIDMVEASFEVVRVEQEMIKDYRSHLAKFFKKTTKRGDDKYKVSEYKFFSFNIQHQYEVEVSKSMMALNRIRFGLLKPNVTPSLPLTPCYSNPIPVKPAKKNDVMKLKKYLKETTRALVDQLTVAGDPVSDDENSDYEN